MYIIYAFIFAAPVDCECHGCSYTPAYWELIVYTCGAIVFVLCFISTIHTIFIKCYQRRHGIAGCCCKCSTCRRQNNYSATNSVAFEDTEPASVVLERQVSVQSEDSGFGSPSTSHISTPSGYTAVPRVTTVSCVEEQNSSTADSCLSSSSNIKDIALLTKQRNTVHTLVLLFSC